MSEFPLKNDQLAADRKKHYLQAMGIDIWVDRLTVRPEVGLPITNTVTEVAKTQSNTAINIANQASDLDGLRREVASCNACGLHETRTQTVFGSGNINADWLFIGEAPGADEDREGEPFVGQAGKLLNSMLFSLGLHRDHVYIANILKCRPPDSRDPRPEETEACEKFLQQQIKLIQPRIIVALGRHAAHALLKTDKTLAKLRGKTYRYENTPLVITYHPAYLLRTPSDKVKSWSDLCLAREQVHGQ